MAGRVLKVVPQHISRDCQQSDIPPKTPSFEKAYGTGKTVLPSTPRLTLKVRMFG